ncbi:MAG: hypothetical protein ACTSYV_03325 [Candidatus Heimdallarchaeaceae archaeon]
MTNQVDSSTMNSNTFLWAQKKDDIIISAYNIPAKLTKDSIQNLFNELCSKNVMFSLYFSNKKRALIIYRKTKKDKNSSEERSSVLKHLISNYSLKPAEIHQLFYPSFTKVIENDTILRLSLENGKDKFVFSYLLSAINNNERNLKKDLTNLMERILNFRFFSLVISSLPSISNSIVKPQWGLLLLCESDDLKSTTYNYEQFIRFLKANSSHLGCKLKLVKAKDLVRHNANFRLLVPWIRHDGFFFDFLNVSKILKAAFIPTFYTQNERFEKIGMKIPKIQVSQNFSSFLDKTPYPSVKYLGGRQYGRSSVQVEKTINNKIAKKQSSIKEQNVEMGAKLNIPSPHIINTVFDMEYLKVRINKMFKELDFKETVIFEEIFDLVLRKDSYYIFVKFYENILTHSHAYEIVEKLGSIAGLRNKFLCIVVADILEENTTKILSEFNILHLTLSDVLQEEKLKNKLYNTILV